MPVARLLDRRGQPLNAGLPVTVGDAADGGRLARIEFSLGSLATGDYVIELTTGTDTNAERYLVPFRVR